MKQTLTCILLAAAIVSPPSFAMADGDPAKGESVFKKCKACHDVGPDAKKKVGPPLNNIIDAPAGAQEGYNYSKPMRDAGAGGLVWDDDKLHSYLENPKKLVPGGKMSFPGLKDEDDRDDVIAYLKTFSKKE
ncbi:MAG: c-type cytochrome [Hyphomicrobiales bacterium]